MREGERGGRERGVERVGKRERVREREREREREGGGGGGQGMSIKNHAAI